MKTAKNVLFLFLFLTLGKQIGEMRCAQILVNVKGTLPEVTVRSLGASERDAYRGSCEICGGIRKLVKSERE